MRFYLGVTIAVAAAIAWAAGYGPVLVAAAVLTLLGWARSRTGTTAGGYRAVSVRGHSHGGRDGTLIAKHEAGHATVARGYGGRVRSARIWDDGGLVQAELPTDDPEAAIAFWKGGEIAAGTGRGAGADRDLIRRELRKVPANQRRDLERRATKQARRIVSRASGQIRRDAATLRAKGHL
ncbi:hypothetical protein [Pseudonocardia xishanensis]|uniref:Uncharacterized protein n=1 Tax=Pseudonocardia xishanensis TaxID=630995 RepID=A0ABP8RYA8_9PSEU